jgi:hypothetical protein
VDALLTLGLGLAALVGALGVLRSFGSRYRVGRLLTAAPEVTIGEAVALARAGRRAYVRIRGRIDSETDFEDADHRPLVFRRTRFQSRKAGRWTDFEVVREAVPFELHEGLDALVVDGDALGEGLVVVPRETVGAVADLGDRVPPEVDRNLPARVVVEQVSSVEHAIALGMPRLEADDRVVLGPGLGRPLILCTLEPAEAMRVLTGGEAARPRLAVGLLIAAAVLLVVGVVLLAVPGDVLAASPSPSPVGGSDTRSPGEGPGFVGAILPALLAVLAIAAVSILGTLAWVRATRDRATPTERPRR